MTDSIKPGDYVRRIGRLIAIEEVTPPPPPKVHDYIFEEVTARAEIRFRGKMLSHLGTYNDFYGEGTAVETAIKEMREHINIEGIRPCDDLEVVVVKVIERQRMRPTKSEREPFAALGHGRLFEMPDPVEFVVWSSHNPDVVVTSP